MLEQAPDLFALPDGALIKTNELWSTPTRRGILPDSKSSVVRKVKAGLLPKPDLDHGVRSRYYRAETLKAVLIGNTEEVAA